MVRVLLINLEGDVVRTIDCSDDTTVVRTLLMLYKSQTYYLSDEAPTWDATDEAGDMIEYDRLRTIRDRVRRQLVLEERERRRAA